MTGTAGNPARDQTGPAGLTTVPPSRAAGVGDPPRRPDGHYATARAGARAKNGCRPWRSIRSRGRQGERPGAGLGLGCRRARRGGRHAGPRPAGLLAGLVPLAHRNPGRHRGRAGPTRFRVDRAAPVPGGMSRPFRITAGAHQPTATFPEGPAQRHARFTVTTPGRRQLMKEFWNARALSRERG